MRLICFVLLLAVLHEALGSEVSFQIEVPGTRCLRREVHPNALVVHTYKTKPQTGVIIRIHITDQKHHTVYKKTLRQQEGKIAYTPDDFDVYEACFTAEYEELADKSQQVMMPITFVTNEGVEARDYNELAVVEKLQPLEMELKRLEDFSTSIVASFLYMQKREEQMRDTNKSTTERVFYFTAFSMGCLLALAFWQVYYLKRFFASKKLI